MDFYKAFSDNDLLLQLKQDDENAFKEIYRRYWQKLLSEASKRLYAVEESKEIVQDVFTSLWLKREQNQIENLQAYLITSVRYQVYMLYNKGKKLPYFEEPLENIALSTVTADGEFEAKELRIFIEAWLKTEPEKRREIFKMRHIDELNTKEISQILNISQKTVKNQLTTSLHSLRSALTKFLALEIALHFIKK